MLQTQLHHIWYTLASVIICVGAIYVRTLEYYCWQQYTLGNFFFTILRNCCYATGTCSLAGGWTGAVSTSGEGLGCIRTGARSNSMHTTRHGCGEHQCKETEGAPVLEPGAIVLARQGPSRDSKRVYYEDVQGSAHENDA